MSKTYNKIKNEPNSIYELGELINQLEAERNRFLTIAYNAITLAQLNEQYNERELLRELDCSKEEYDEIME